VTRGFQLQFTAAAASPDGEFVRLEVQAPVSRASEVQPWMVPGIPQLVLPQHMHPRITSGDSSDWADRDEARQGGHQPTRLKFTICLPLDKFLDVDGRFDVM